MSCVWAWLLFCVSATAVAQQPSPPASQDADIMLAAVSRDQSMLSGGIASSKWTGRGTVVVEPLARMTPLGQWVDLPCSSKNQKNCLKFARDYLSKVHLYTVVSADGKGATIHSAPTTLSECYDYSGTGTYSGAPITKSAIAASSADFFAESTPPQPLDQEETATLRKALAMLTPKKLDSTMDLRFFRLRLEGQDMFVVQRAFADMTAHGTGRFIFTIGTMDQSRFQILHWNQNTEDEEESVLGTIRLKSGREFLVTVVSDPESHFFRVYGVRAGRLALIYSGGGSSC
jgi:hypothetical protein